MSHRSKSPRFVLIEDVSLLQQANDVRNGRAFRGGVLVAESAGASRNGNRASSVRWTGMLPGAGGAVRQDVQVTLGSPCEAEGEAWVPIRWTPTSHGRLLPSFDGVVEIAYGVKPEHQGNGYATEAAAGLVKYAFASGVHTVRAHTLREPNASTRVLGKCGFQNVGEVVDPDDGLVWRWELCNRP